MHVNVLPAFMYGYHVCVMSPGVKRHRTPLELELEMAERHHVGLGMVPKSSLKEKQVL